MGNKDIQLSVFTKPWKTKTIEEIGKAIHGMGADGIEFPVRRGFQVEPEQAEKELLRLAKEFAAYGLQIFSVASTAEERVFAGCAAAGIPQIRIMIDIDLGLGYLETERIIQEDMEKRIIPLCKAYGVKVGIQNHSGKMICNAMGLRHLIEGFDPRYIGAIWDSAHNALCGEEPELGLEIVWSHLHMVNLKNALYWPAVGPEAEVARWKHHYTTGRKGLSPWSRVAAYLQQQKYQGVICLCAEYSGADLEHVEQYTKEDIQYIKELFRLS